MKKVFYCLTVVVFIFSSCSNEKGSNEENKTVQPVASFPPAPAFNEDSAYAYIKTQVDFGPRIPGTPAHAKCADYFISKLGSFGWKVQMQNANITTYDGKHFNLKNIVASYKPELEKRILLISHWDTRPWADQDSLHPDLPADGADDGASGAGVLLEIARQLSLSNPTVGVDIFLNDLEDYGKENGEGNTWCLGTQYWANNPHKIGYKAQYGILLDMVGAKNAIFPREGLSKEYAPYIVKKIWNKAAHLGYSNYFVFQDAGSITDDHAYINAIANIPCVDIINMNPATNEFGTHHHRHSDNLNIIDKNILKVVGQTVLEVLWEEQAPSDSIHNS